MDKINKNIWLLTGQESKNKIMKNKINRLIEGYNKLLKRIDEPIEGYNNIWEAIRDIQGKLSIIKTVVDDMVEKGV